MKGSKRQVFTPHPSLFTFNPWYPVPLPTPTQEEAMTVEPQSFEYDCETLGEIVRVKLEHDRMRTTRKASRHVILHNVEVLYCTGGGRCKYDLASNDPKRICPERDSLITIGKSKLSES